MVTNGNASSNSRANRNPARAVHTPAEAAQAAIRAAAALSTNTVRGLRYFVRGLDTYIAPILPGQTALLVAQTSHFKSGALDAWTTDAAAQLMDEDRFDEAIVVVSAEETVEEQIYRMLARYSGENAYAISTGNVHSWDGVQMAAAQVGAIPIYRVAESLERSEELPEMHFSNVVRALQALYRGDITGKPVRFAAVFVDYLQAFPFDPEIKRAPGNDQRRLQVAADFERMYQGARYFNCPWVVAAQAKAMLESSSKDFPIPGVWDIHETSDPARRAHRIITQWMPKQTHMVGTEIERKGITFSVQEDMLWQRAVKQRGNLPAGRSWLLQIDYQTYAVKKHPLQENWEKRNIAVG